MAQPIEERGEEDTSKQTRHDEQGISKQMTFLGRCLYGDLIAGCGKCLCETGLGVEIGPGKSGQGEVLVCDNRKPLCIAAQVATVDDLASYLCLALENQWTLEWEMQCPYPLQRASPFNGYREIDWGICLYTVLIDMTFESVVSCDMDACG